MIININTDFKKLFQQVSNEFEIIKSKSGLPTLKEQGIFIHSKYSPEKEAEKIANIPNVKNTSWIFILGLGLGYHVHSAIKKMQNLPCKIFIFEKNIETVKLCHEVGNLNFINNENVKLFVGDDALDDFYSIKDDLLIDEIRGHRTITLSSSVKLSKEYYDNILLNINNIISSLFINRFTHYEMERMWIQNIIKNSHIILKKFMRINNDSKNNQNAVVISAGPSLKHSLDVLEKIQHNVFIFCVDTALGALMDKGIVPDFVVSLDAQIHNEKDFYTSINEKKSIKIVAGASVYSGVFDFGEDYYIFTALKDNPLIKLIENNLKQEIFNLETGISISTAAINLAISCNFNEIYLLGQDLAYTGMMTHVQGSPVYNYFLYKTNRFHTLPTQFYNQIRKRKVCKKNGLYVDIMFDKLKDYIEEQISDKSMTFYNVSDGQHINSTIKLTNNEFYEKTKNSAKEDIPIENYSVEKVNLVNLYENISDLLVNFKDMLLNQEEIDIEYVLSEKTKLEDIYQFLKSYFQLDDLYFKRKADEEPNKRNTFYVLSLINRTKALIKSLKIGIKKLKKK